MGEAWFYHLTASPVEVTLPMLLEKCMSAGWRVVVRGGDADRLAWLDEKLWLVSQDGFLPHGLAGGPHDADQPVLLTTGAGRPNGAACVMAVDGAGVAADEMDGLARAILLFDGNDDSAVKAARGQWSALTGAGVKAVYWAEEDGRWKKKAESGGS